MEPLTWKEIKNKIKETGVKPFPGSGIKNYCKEETTILRSVDNTYYYDDKLRDDDYQKVEYTLFGHNGDQNENEKKFNEPLLNPDKIKHIYLYRVKTNEKKKEYLWYGKYKIVGKYNKLHQGKDNIMRTIIILKLNQI